MNSTDDSWQKVTSILFIHGIGDQKSPLVVRATIQDGLELDRLGEHLRLGYWSHITHPESTTPDELNPMMIDAQLSQFDHEVERLSQEEREFYSQLEGAISRFSGVDSDDEGEDFESLLLPLPRFMRRGATRLFTKLFTRDVSRYFFNQELRSRIQQCVREKIESLSNRKFIIVAHSLGSVIAHDMLSILAEEEHSIECDTLVTLGSPLGVQEVQDNLHGGRVTPASIRIWYNIAARGDIVCLDKELVSDFDRAEGQTIRDSKVDNPERSFPFGAHSLKGYLKTGPAREAIFSSLDDDFRNPHRNFQVARDLAEEFSIPDKRVSVLVEINENLPLSRDELKVAVDRAFAEEEIDKDEALLEFHRHFISAKLTESEYFRLTARFPESSIHRSWKDLDKFANLNESKKTIHVPPARIAYQATGHRINWAVLDTGVNASHPHFTPDGSRSLIIENLDCTQHGPINRLPAAYDDPQGHGTHVAGIITGSNPNSADNEPSGVAPLTSLYSYKVLDDQGYGRDSYIIKALDDIFVINEQAARLVIHGINLSLGGPFDFQSFGCGDSPICRELRRLWRQGVVVCIAAGNSGKVGLINSQGHTQYYNNESSIGDPANLEEAIVVGSVNKFRPHSYGVSYFSSKGPTADGRNKPDVVAPGENILSCRSDLTQSPYVELSGTSMACPHISGMIAAFLSVKSEFIGKSDEVKRKLIQTCIDLERDPSYQGHGLPHLMKMLMSS